MLRAQPATSARANTGPQRVLMTYYGDAPRRRHRPRAEPARRDAERRRSTCRTRSACSARAACACSSSPAIGLEYWVFNLAPQRHLARAQERRAEPRDPHARWPGRSIARSSCRPRCSGTARPGNTQLSRSYGRFTLDLSDDPTLGYHYDPARARRILEQAGWKLGPDGVRRKDGVRAEFELAYAGESSEKRAVTLIRSLGAGTSASTIDVRIYDTDKLDQPRVQQGRRAQLRPDFDTELWSIGGDPTPEFLLSLFTKAQIGVWNDSGFTDPRYEQLYQQELRATDDAARVSAIHAAAAHRDDAAAVHRALRGRRHQRRQHAHVVELDDAARRRTASRSRPTATTRSSRCARASWRRRAIRACPGRSPCWARWPRWRSARPSSRAAASSASRSRSRTRPHEAPGRRRSSRWRWSRSRSC